MTKVNITNTNTTKLKELIFQIITTEKINKFLAKNRESIIRKLTLTATIIDKTISEKEDEVKKGDIQEIRKKTTTKRKQIVEVATIFLAIIHKIEKLQTL